jgi:4-hydroxy-tetrahydrodipicolinate synthase
MSIKKGIYAASMTVINKDLSVNIDSTIEHSERLIQQGCHGVVIGGSTGMSQLISSNEKRKLIDKMSISKFKDNFVFGTGANSMNENVQLMKHCIENKINKFLIMPSAYYKYNDDGAYSFYANIIERVPESEIILYNFSKLSGYSFSIKIIEKLVKDFQKQIVGIKDSDYQLYDKLKIPNFMIFPGSETKLLKGLELGNSGIISAICNVTASLARKVYDDFHGKKKQTFNERLCAIRKVFDKNNLISGLHSFMSIEDVKYKIVLPPLSLLTKEQEKQMIDELKALDFYPERKAA